MNNKTDEYGDDFLQIFTILSFDFLFYLLAGAYQQSIAPPHMHSYKIGGPGGPPYSPQPSQQQQYPPGKFHLLFFYFRVTKTDQKCSMNFMKEGLMLVKNKIKPRVLQVVSSV